ncbi:MAG: Asp-tRNA(Asn)/Glu-tRNA(Gln) amidotransferase subunit GatC [bacterium]|nr:Asp-tRNA(Asn)/Glu-tRNA(Gln) amidotransferase subunit GatC [bacterium]
MKLDIAHIAKLANLSLTPAEEKKFSRQLGEILDYIAKLNKLDTEKIEPTSQVTGLENVWREDEISPSLSQKDALSGARDKTDDLFKAEAIFK